MAAGSIAPELEKILRQSPDTARIAVIAQTARQADLNALSAQTTYDEKIALLKSVAAQAQPEFVRFLTAQDARDIRGFWLVSRVAFKATPAVIRAAAQRPDIASIGDDARVRIDDTRSTSPADATEWNISKVQADSCWAEGYDGAGVVVGNIDTGIEAAHPAFGNRWRAQNGWFDAVNGQPDPYDDNNHGTHTMGIIAGGDGLGPFAKDIGVAPGATIIAAKGFDSGGSGQYTDIDACFEWLADTGRPQVISNSWAGNRTNTHFFATIQNLRSLGIITVFAIGNQQGAPSGSSSSPGNYPNTIGAGATGSRDSIATFSQRGPAPDTLPWNVPGNWPRTDWNLINPDIAAPGVGVRSSAPGDTYEFMSGTSMACPHVAGCVALMLQKSPSLTPNQVFNLLADNADHPAQGGTYPNNQYGWGRLNCKRTLDMTALPNRPNLLYRRTVVEDQNGNHRIDPGETADLIAWLWNATTTPATNLYGTLHTTDPYILVQDSSAVFGTLAGWDSTGNDLDRFTVSADAGCPQGHVAEFSLSLTCSETSLVKQFNLTVGEPILAPGTVIWGPRPLPGLPDIVGITGVAYNPVNERLYVAHYCARRIFMFSADTLLDSLGSIPTPNSESACTDLEYSASDNTFWVASHQTKRVYKITADGTILRWFYDLTANYPFGVTWDPATHLLYLSDRRYQGVTPGYVYVTDSLGVQVRRMTIPLSGNMGPRGLALEQTGSNPDRPTLLMAYTSYNNVGQEVDSSGIYELLPSDCSVLRRFLSLERYAFRGVEYDPRDASLWATVTTDGGVNNLILKYVGFHASTALAETPARSLGSSIRLDCAPNPFRNRLSASLVLPQTSPVRVSVRDITGRELGIIAQGQYAAGRHQFTWDRTGLGPGIYFITVQTPSWTTWHKAVKL